MWSCWCIPIQGCKVHSDETIACSDCGRLQPPKNVTKLIIFSTTKVIIYLLLISLTLFTSAVSATAKPNEMLIPSYSLEEQNNILQNEFDAATAYLQSINLPVTNRTVKIVSQEDFTAALGWQAWAMARPSGVWIKPRVAARMVTALYRERNCPKKAIGLDHGYRSLILHELLHYITGIKHYEKSANSVLESNTYLNGLPLEEGIVDTVTYDLLKGYIKYRYIGKRLPNNYQDIVLSTIAMGSPYFNNIKYVRALSAKISNSHSWNAREAFQVRIKLLMSTFELRQEIINEYR